MTNKILKLLFLLSLFFSFELQAQNEYVLSDTVKLRQFKNIEYKIETQGSFSVNKTPLWLNANKYGLSSLKDINSYLRIAAERNISTDNGRKWGIGYGVDLATAINYTSNFIVNQAYIEGRYLKGILTIGAKEYSLELKNNEYSSGSQTLGINARPIPQVRLSLPEYWTLPFANGYLHIKGHIAFGKMTDDSWQHKYTSKKSNYADNVLYHSKACYLKIANVAGFSPWSIELGLEMVSTFGGTSYSFDDKGTLIDVVKNNTNFNAYYHAFIPGGSDIGETTYQNSEGNHFGSWLMRITYNGNINRYSIYMDKYFEDHSSMFLLDYDGYVPGIEWRKKKKKSFLRYGLKDFLLGFEYNFKQIHWLNTLVIEYITSKYQSGPIYHDHTKTVADHIGGKDNYYNHFLYTGNQHWGQSMGNPLYRSPIYNEDGKIEFENNRFSALYIALGGRPNSYLRWRVIASLQDGLGTYNNPYMYKKYNASLMTEIDYQLNLNNKSWFNGTRIKLGLGVDHGSILGTNNYGMQLTFTKTGIF